MNIIVMGPQGSGKSTQAKKLAKDLGLTYLSTGEILRELAESGDPLGEEAKKYWQEGKLVPNNLMGEILGSWLDSQEQKNGYVLDGYPRRIDQAKFLEEKILAGRKIDIVYYIDIPRKEILRRLTLRVKTEHRLDETPKAIAKRLDEYQKNTVPVLDFYQKKGILIKINGVNSIDEVYQKIFSCLSQKP